MKKIIVALVFLTTSIYAQKNINNYKYILVPKQFEFVKKANQYKTSSLTKFLFNKYGFKAFFTDEKLPEDLVKNRCLALIANVKDHSGMFSTKNNIVLKNCYNTVIFTSKEGKSKEKEYKKAYQEAIRKAFKSIKELNYVYKSKAGTVISKPLKENIIVEKATPLSNVVNLLYAQPIKNGFQLVNTKPKVVFQIMKTNIKDVFIVKNKNGIFYKMGTNWIVECYENSRLIQKQFQVKF